MLMNGSKRELEQLCVLGALAFHTGTFTLLAPDVDTKKALHSRNHVAYRSLHRLKTVFHSVFVLKQFLLTHDDMQGANKMCNIEKSRINRAIEKSRINRPIVELSRRAGLTRRSTRAGSIGRSANAHAHTHNEIDKTIVNAHLTTLLNLMISV